MGITLFHEGWSRAIDVTPSTLLLLAVRGIRRAILGLHPLNHLYEIRHKAGHEALQSRRVAAQDEFVDDPRLIELLDHCNARFHTGDHSRHEHHRRVEATNHPARRTRRSKWTNEQLKFCEAVNPSPPKLTFPRRSGFGARLRSIPRTFTARAGRAFADMILSRATYRTGGSESKSRELQPIAVMKRTRRKCENSFAVKWGNENAGKKEENT